MIKQPDITSAYQAESFPEGIRMLEAERGTPAEIVNQFIGNLTSTDTYELIDRLFQCADRHEGSHNTGDQLKSSLMQHRSRIIQEQYDIAVTQDPSSRPHECYAPISIFKSHSMDQATHHALQMLILGLIPTGSKSATNKRMLSRLGGGVKGFRTTPYSNQVHTTIEHYDCSTTERGTSFTLELQTSRDGSTEITLIPQLFSNSQYPDAREREQEYVGQITNLITPMLN